MIYDSAYGKPLLGYQQIAGLVPFGKPISSTDTVTTTYFNLIRPIIIIIIIIIDTLQHYTVFQMYTDNCCALK